MNKQRIAIYGGAVLIGGAVLYFALKKTASGLSAVGEAFNPTSQNNLAYRGVNSVGSAITGDEHFTLGGWLYEITHPDPVEAMQPNSTAIFNSAAMRAAAQNDLQAVETATSSASDHYDAMGNYQGRW